MISSENEILTSIAFSKQAAVFDSLYSFNTIIDYKRKRVREHLHQFIKPNSSILELNSGTGEDAVYFANNGHSVHAIDIAPGMQKVLKEKILFHNLQDKISAEHCSYTQLHLLQKKGPYDVVFSNFAGLNCTGQLKQVLEELIPFVKPGGLVTLVILPKFCLWEMMLLFKGKFRTASRRFFSAKGRIANVEGAEFSCWYHNPSFVKKCLKTEFTMVSVEGLCTFVPPSYIENFAERYSKTYSMLQRLENKLKSKWPWRSIGDYYIITLRKKAT